MIKFLILFLFICNIASASAPTRAYTYVSNTNIDPAQVNTNENSLYSYLQTGVDTYAAGSITGAAISASASIPYVSLSLSNSIVNADISSSAAIVGSKLNLASAGVIGSGTPAAGTFTTLTGTDVTASSTLKLGSTNQGDILYDNGTSLVRLTPGTSGQVLKTGGSSANPSWVNGLSSVSDYGTSASTATARQATAVKVAFGHDISVAAGSSTALSNLPFSSSSSYTIVCSANSSFGTPPAGTDQNAGNIVCATSSGSAATIYNTDDQTKTVAWMAIGT